MRHKATWTQAEKKPRAPGVYQVQTPKTKCGCCWEEADFRDGGWWRYGMYGTLKVRQAVTVTHWRASLLNADVTGLAPKKED